MAFASSRIEAQEAFITPCDLCEDEEDVNWFCVDCVQNLCERCTKMHLKIVTCKNHGLVPILEGVAIQKKNVSNLCQEHKEPLSFFCQTCEENICLICLSVVHKKHDFAYLRDLHSELQSILENVIKEKEREQTKIVKSIDDLGKCTNQCRDTLTKNNILIDERMKAIHTSVDEEGQKLKEILKAATEGQIKEIKERKQILEGIKNEYDETIQTVKQELNLQTTSTFGQFAKFSTSKLQSLKPIAFSITMDTKFIPCMTCQEVIVDMIGITESKINIRELQEKEKISICSELQIIRNHKLKLESDCISICMSPDDSIWLGGKEYVYKMSLNCLTFHNQIPLANDTSPFRRLNSCQYIACLKSGDAIASYDRPSASLDRFTFDGRRVEVINSSDRYIRDIAITDNNEVVVAEAKEYSSEASSLGVYSTVGRQLNTIRLDTEVGDFCINNDGNYVVSEGRSSCLTTLDSRGSVLKKVLISEPWLCRIKCDKYGNILGLPRHSTCSSKEVYLISDDGKEERLFIVECDYRIDDICIDNDNRLLILVDESKLIIAEYIEQKS